jgi:hypothetical protein
LTGNAASGAVGSVVPGKQFALTGVEAVGETGYLSIPFTGVEAIGDIGSVTVSYTFNLTGTPIDAAVGSVGLGDRALALTGVASSGAVGDVIAVYWKPIDDSQTANWQNISDAQTAAWAVIANAQESSWTTVTTGQTPSWGTIGDNQTPGWVLVDNAT